MSKAHDAKLDAALDGSVEMRVSTKKPPKCYARAALSFLKGIEARPAEEEPDVKLMEAKIPVHYLRISGRGKAINAAIAAATQAKAEGCCEIARIQTSYVEMEASRRSCAQIVIDLEKK